jgi:hypothetical protein
MGVAMNTGTSGSDGRGRPRLLHSSFELSAARWPDALALAMPRQQFTYRELGDISDSLAGRVRRSGVVPDDVMAISAPKGWGQVIWVDAPPVTATGKVDRAHLATSLAGDATVQASGRAAGGDPSHNRDPHGHDREKSGRGKDERELFFSQTFCKVLGAGEVDREAAFFELGRRSLLALRLANKVRESLSVEIRLEVIFDHRSVRALAEALAR